MKTATYTKLDGENISIEYDENAPCRVCGYPVTEASMGGTDVCPWCDTGEERPDVSECCDCGWKGLTKDLGTTKLDNDTLVCCPKCKALPWYDDIRNK